MVDRAVTLKDIRSIVTGRAKSQVPSPRLTFEDRATRLGPMPACVGPTVGKLGENCAACESVAIPPYEAPTTCPPDDSCERSTIRRAVVEALRESPTIGTIPSPQQDPGYIGRSTTWTPPGAVVVVQGGSAAAIAAATILRLAAGFAPGPTALGIGAVVALGSTGAPVVVASFLAPDDRAAVAKRLWITASALSAFAVLQFTVEVAGEPALPLFNASPGKEYAINVSAPPGTSVVVKAACLDSTAAFVLRVRVDGWTLPVVTNDQSIDALIHRHDPARNRPR